MEVQLSLAPSQHNFHEHSVNLANAVLLSIFSIQNRTETLIGVSDVPANIHRQLKLLDELLPLRRSEDIFYLFSKSADLLRALCSALKSKQTPVSDVTDGRKESREQSQHAGAEAPLDERHPPNQTQQPKIKKSCHSCTRPFLTRQEAKNHCKKCRKRVYKTKNPALIEVLQPSECGPSCCSSCKNASIYKNGLCLACVQKAAQPDGESTTSIAAEGHPAEPVVPSCSIAQIIGSHFSNNELPTVNSDSLRPPHCTNGDHNRHTGIPCSMVGCANSVTQKHLVYCNSCFHNTNLRTCNRCGRVRRHKAKGMCLSCYKSQKNHNLSPSEFHRLKGRSEVSHDLHHLTRTNGSSSGIMKNCKKCGEYRKYCARGMCRRCYQSEYKSCSVTKDTPEPEKQPDNMDSSPKIEVVDLTEETPENTPTPSQPMQNVPEILRLLFNPNAN